MTNSKFGGTTALATKRNDEQRGVCSSCQKPRYRLRMRKSKLLPNAQLMLCDECFDQKKEPRAAVVMVGRQFGIDAIADYIKHRRYVGDPILVSEIIRKNPK